MTDTIEQRIEAKTDLAIAGSTQVSSAVGGLSFKDMGQVMEFSKLMAVAGQAVPKHLRGAPGACLAVSLQALNWRMDPFAVANKSYAVNDRIAYEAQLIHAVIEQRAPIRGRIKGKPEGEGPTRRWRLWCDTTEGDRIEYEGPEISTIAVKNSPLWKADPDQQLWYYSVRAMCRRHFPDVILGVYEKEEMAEMRDITPPEPGRFAQKAQEARKPSTLPEPEEAAPEPSQDVQEVSEAEVIPEETMPVYTLAEVQQKIDAAKDEAELKAVADMVGKLQPSEVEAARSRYKSKLALLRTPEPDYEAEGRAAFAAGVQDIDCPYPSGEPQKRWLDGWFQAEEESRKQSVEEAPE